MNTTAFHELTEKKKSLYKRLADVRRHRTDAKALYYKNSARFTVIALGVALAELLVLSLLFDYAVMLNFVLTRIVLWLLISVILATLSRFMHAWLFVTTHTEDVLRSKQRRLQHRAHAIEDYESGVIDASGIRLLYQEEERVAPPRMFRVAQLYDWALYICVMLATVLLGLIFV